MKTDCSHLDKYRISGGMFKSPNGADYGRFEIERTKFSYLRIISSGSVGPGNDSGWEHVSVSRKDRCPTWDDMCFVKDLFWGEDETVIQFHPKKIKYVNVHPFCLHLWKRAGAEHELPPDICV